MQARQQEQHQAVAQGETSDSMIGFDFLALSGFDSTRRISNSDTSTTDSSESVETKMRKNRKDSAKTSHEKQSPSHSGKASPMSQSVRTNSSHEDYLPSHRHRDDTGPGARSEPPGLHKSEVDTLVQQLHNARVTADTSLHALADLRTEHSILLDQLAQVKLEKAELDGYVGQLRMLVKSVEMERKAAVEKCEKLDHELQQTENALVKARMKCADFEDDRSTASGELHKLGSFVHELNKAGLIKVELPGEISRIVLSCASISSHNSNSNPNPNSNTSYKFIPRDSQPNTAQKASKSKYSLLQSFGMGGGGNSNSNSNNNNSGDTNPVDNTPRSMNYGVGGRFSHSLHRGTLGGGMRHSTSLSTASPPANIDLINDVVSFARSSVGNASSPSSRRPNVDHSRPYRNSRIPSKSINPSLFGITSSGSASPSPNVSANTSPNPSPNASANTNVSVSGADGNTNI
ncbi:hypothetical protein AX774_g1001 [Zancudomyces culisetae]|uniref:Uncharacterized protein n=1 Tax=Zancudomyces culisetae TaxID=1213189 RepID=A0A1R1PWX4_ZANCU|nr:hypothetical protein AX774_g1001 [Zancudomyces culisetae]|eukprot:OMH85449.1 hypothetical protein AX774_g1001 [Zancudomyces culisetae]